MTFNRDGYPIYTYHGPPCDCWRHCHQQENFNEYLNYVREIAIDEPNGIGKNLSILFMDLKLDYLDQHGKARAGTELAKSIVSNLFIDSQTTLDNSTLPNNNTKLAQVSLQKSKLPSLYLILSVNHVNDIDLIQNFLHYLEINNSSHLMNLIGFDVGMNDDLQQIESMWRRFGNGLNLWQGDGYTNCFSPFYNLERLSRALVKRDSPVGYPAKVYHWTIDLHDRMRESLMMGVDAVMTNHPERLLTVLHEPDIAHEYRLADRLDNPFKKLTRLSLGRSSETARYQRSTGSTSGGFFGNLIDVFSSWLNYIREIPFLSFPTTTRLFSRSSNSPRQHRLSSSSQQGISVTKMQNQPEYKVDPPNARDGELKQQNLAIAGLFGGLTGNGNSTGSEKSTSISDSVDQVILGEKQQQQRIPFEGPKWYTSLVSNVLVSIMKIILPVP